MLEITWGASEAWPFTLEYARRGWIGGRYACSWRAWSEGATLRVVSFRQNGSGCDPRNWDDRLAGADWAEADLGSGDITADTIAAAFVTAAATLGSTWTRVGAVTTHATALDAIAPPFRTEDESEAGMVGAQRHSFGDGSTDSGGMGGIGLHHLAWTFGAARIRAIYMRSSGGLDVRVFFADGPAYAANPTALSNIVQGVITAAAANDLRAYLPTEPRAVTDGNRWIGFKGPGGQNLRFRYEGASPAGLGDFSSAGTLVFDTSASDPSVALPADYDPANGGGNYDLVSWIGVVVDFADGDGRYRTCEVVRTYVGWHGADPTATVGSGPPERTIAPDMFDETVHFRWRILHLLTAQLTAIDLGVGLWSAAEDFGGAIYEWPDLAIPSAGSPALLRSIGAWGTTAANSWNRHTLATPLEIGETALGAASIIGLGLNCGNRSGIGIPTTLELLFDPNSGASEVYPTAWVDARNQWTDLMSEGANGLDEETEYQTRATNGSTAPNGNPNAVWPANLPIDTTLVTDAGPENLSRFRLLVVSDQSATVVETPNGGTGGQPAALAWAHLWW